VTGYLTPPLSLFYPHEKLFVKASYCSICRILASRRLYLNRAFLNYDAIFFYLLFSASLQSYNFSIESFFCKHTMTNRFLIKDNGILNYFADYSTLFSILKFYDNINDEKFPSSFFSSIFYKKFSNSFKFLNKSSILQSMDKDKSFDNEIVDLITLIESIFPFDYLNYQYRNPISSIISNLIKLIYYIDAVDDFKDDLKKSKKNILLSGETKSINSNDIEFIQKKLKNECIFSINYCLNQLEKLPNKQFVHILKLYFSDLIPALLNKALKKNGWMEIFQ